MYKQNVYVCRPMSKCSAKYGGCLYYSSNALARVMTKMADDAFNSVGLTVSYAFLLMTINDDEGINPTQISQHMQLTPSTVTRLIEKMEFKGYVKREQCGRNTTVFLTPEGEELIPKIKESWKKLKSNYSELMGEERTEKLNLAIGDALQQLE